MSQTFHSLYSSIYETYQKTYKDKAKKDCQDETNKIWLVLKKEFKNISELSVAVEKKLQELRQIQLKKKSTLLSFWSTIPQNSLKAGERDAVEIISISQPSVLPSSAPANNNADRILSAPKQFKLEKEISNLEKDFLYLREKRDLKLLSEDDFRLLSIKQKDLKIKKKQLLNRKKASERQKNVRLKRKRAMEDLEPEMRKKLCGKTEISRGRPQKVLDEDDLIAAIINIAMTGSASDEKRRTEMICSVKTLDDLTEELRKQGFNLSRSSVYLRLLPNRSLSNEGKRHVKTAPVKLIRAQNSEHASHVDTKFAKSTLNALEEIASILGPKEVTFHSQDDKARVPIGLTAANKQSPMVMHMEYKITLADHDFVIAPQHKLIPSVIAAMEIKENCIGKDAVTYSGPTYVAIRSAKHDSSTALSHLEDMNRINSLPSFQNSLFTTDGLSKPVMIITVDGGPDENPRYEKTICCAKIYFREHDLDALYIATNAPGRSAFNRVERRMAPLSHDLAGVILPHDQFGSHLNSRAETTDTQLEKDNFAKAGQTLASIWSDTVIDGFETVAEYKEPKAENSEKSVNIQFGAQWDAEHIRESQYFLQVVKCNNIQCCGPRRSSLFNVLKTGFLPPPLALVQADDGLKCNSSDNKNRFMSLFLNIALDKSIVPSKAFKKFPKGLPYDFSCPSVENVLPRRICADCGIYFATIKSMKVHKNICNSKTPKNFSKQEEKLRPQRLAARRQQELLCVIVGSEEETFEWHNEEDVETEGLVVPTVTTVVHGTPILSKHKAIWEEI
jgi:hypothetical protein